MNNNNKSRLFTIDASVFIKTIINEDDSELVLQLLESLSDINARILNPTLFEYEIIKICISNNIDIKLVTQLLDAYKKASLELIHPSLNDMNKAKEIIYSCQRESWLPSFYDVIYHAIALNNNSILITADKKYSEKAKNFGSIIILNNNTVLNLCEN